MSKEDDYRKEHPDELRIYDVATDDFRGATQRDIDLLTRAALNGAGLRESINDLYAASQEQHDAYIKAAMTMVPNLYDN